MAFTDVYVDPSINANSGTGSSGDPYGDLQYALDQTTAGGTGHRFNIKAGTSEILTASLSTATYGSVTTAAPLQFRGYTSTAGDGGIGVIDGNALYSILSGSYIHTSFVDLRLTNTGSNVIISNTNLNMSVVNCEIDTSTVGGLNIDQRCNVRNCYFHDIAGYGVYVNDINSFISGNYFKNGATDKFTNAVQCQSGGAVISNNVFSLDSTSDGIDLTSVCQVFIDNNSIFSNAGTGSGIMATNSNVQVMSVTNNLVEGFSGTGGVGINFNSSSSTPGLLANNAVYNCATAYSLATNNDASYAADNETLGASPFAKSGSDTFANRATYFAPVDTGNVHGGAFPTDLRLDKGAVQHADPAGGGGGGRQGLHGIETGTV